MQEKKSFEKLFQTQNINIRKSIRELDMGYDTLNVYCSNSKRPDVNILVVGPNGSGKSTLLRTMHYALNGNLACYVENRNASQMCYNRYQIKKNKRFAVQGLTKVKQTDEKLGVYGYEPNFSFISNQHLNPMDKYAKAVQFMNNRGLGCISNSQSSTGNGINFVIVCLNMVQKISKQEVIALRFFIQQIQEKKIKFIIVGTHLDVILGRDSNSLTSSYASNTEQEKVLYVEDWKKFIQAQLCPKILVQIYCMQNYSNIFKKQGFENSQTINYYSLTLLDKCIKKAPQSEKPRKISLKFFCF